MNALLSAKLIAYAVVLSTATSFIPRDNLMDGLFDVGGRSIGLSCRGKGAPVAVIDAGMGTAPVEDSGWRGIASRVSQSTRVCLYDRAGLGGSDPAPAGTRTSLDAAHDLHSALSAAGEKGPYVLVGHSLGGLHAQVFAAQYPEDVVGLVLLSTTHPDQFSRWAALLPSPGPSEEKAVTELRTFLNSVADPTGNEERLDMRASAKQARHLGFLGNRPVIIATHSPRFRMVPGLSEPLSVKLEDATQRMQREFLSLSTNAHQNIADGAGHGLPHEAPDFVVDNMLEAVVAIRGLSLQH